MGFSDYLTLLLITLNSVTHSSVSQSIKNCIHEKYYRYSPSHTACIQKSKGASQSGVSDADRKFIVDRHNYYRALQNATNMQKMVWDDELAMLAQRWTDNCVFEHDGNRSIPGRFSVGQNLAAGYNSWEESLKGWYDEISIFTFGHQGNLKAVGHYTQLAWNSSAKVGCGFTYCTTLDYGTLYGCNYGPSGNAGDWSKPFTPGKRCSQCPNSCKNGLCDCGGKVCENGGTLDVNTCECRCLKPWHTPGTCSLNCSAVIEGFSCGTGRFYDGKCFKYYNVPYECPNMCNICPYSDASVPESSAFQKESHKAWLIIPIGCLVFFLSDFK